MTHFANNKRKKLSGYRTYTVATSGFVANGGDGYEIFTTGTLVSYDKMMSEVLLDGFKTMTPIRLPSLDRQIDISL
ncbi:MAG: hypothetical protein ABJK37_03735 [Paraglaciecola sp.]|uniref:hypothetical protein n=1 Tax=Paraglaciecola sp. TaxID=1920173 RepID=UPI003299D141